MIPLQLDHTTNNMGYNLAVWSVSQNLDKTRHSDSKRQSVKSVKLESMFTKQKKSHELNKQSNLVPPYAGFGNIFKD